MSLFTGILFLASLAAVHFWWRSRYQQIEGEWSHSRASLELAQQRHYQEITQIEAEQQAVFNSMAEGVLILDKSGRIQLVNRSLQELFDLKADVRSQTIMEAFRMQELAEIHRRLPAERVVRAFELEMPGMASRWAEVNAAAVNDRTGELRGSIMVFHDLTRIKQLESSRQEFVANVSHELRTPLSLIKGFVETLLDGAKDDPEHAARFLGTIARHTDRLTYLIEDLLTISQLESGRIVMNLAPLSLREEAQHVMEDLQLRAAEKNTRITNEIPAELLGSADADRMHQVFFNLIENAIKYGKTGGSVVLGGGINERKLVEIWIRDDGPGISLEAQKRIFERFFRVDRARARDTGGTGLGLAIVKHIIHGHGGEVWVKSAPEKGATFYFTLKPV